MNGIYFLDFGGVGVLDMLIFSSRHYSFWSFSTKVDDFSIFGGEGLGTVIFGLVPKFVILPTFNENRLF